MRQLATYLALPTLAIAGSALAGDDFSELRYTTVTEYAFTGAPANGQSNSATGIWDGYGQFYSNDYNAPATPYATSVFYDGNFYDNYEYNGDRFTAYAYNRSGTVGATGAFTATFTLSDWCAITELNMDSSMGFTIDGNAVAVGSLLSAGQHTMQFNITYVAGAAVLPKQSEVVWNQTTLPAPGAIALLGLAGLAGRRRR